MHYKRARIGTRVRINRDIDQAAEGTEGVIVEQRGYNRDEGGKIIARFVHVWSEFTPEGKPSRKNICVSTNCLDEI